MANEVQTKRPVHLWKKGESGNPKGRPVGVKNKITMMKQALEGELRTQLGPQMAEILTKAIELAKAGDTQMIKLLLDKTVPTTKASEDEGTGDNKILIQIGKLPERKEDEEVVINGDKLNG